MFNMHFCSYNCTNTNGEQFNLDEVPNIANTARFFWIFKNEKPKFKGYGYLIRDFLKHREHK